MGDLSRELQNAKDVVKEKEGIYSKLEEELRKKAETMGSGEEQKTKLKERIEDLTAENKLLLNQK